MVNWETAIELLGINNDDDWIEWWGIEGDFPWRPNLEKQIFGVKKPDYTEERIKQIVNAIDRIDVAVCFCSAYGECDSARTFRITESVPCDFASSD